MCGSLVLGGGGCQCGDCRSHTKQTVEQEGGRKIPAHCKWPNVPRSFWKIILGTDIAKGTGKHHDRRTANPSRWPRPELTELTPIVDAISVNSALMTAKIRSPALIDQFFFSALIRPIAGEGWTTGRGGDGGRRARRARTGRRLPLRAFEALHSSMLGMSTGAIGSPHSRRFLLSKIHVLVLLARLSAGRL